MLFQSPGPEQDEAELPGGTGFGQIIPVGAGDLHEKGLSGANTSDIAANLEMAEAGDRILKQIKRPVNPGFAVPAVICGNHMIITQGKKLV
ncbi:hypothetical protein D3C75_1093000 [compost metagenome]